jgi:hypothetical protein
MNLSDAKGRLARWRLRLSEFTLKIEYHAGVAYHVFNAMSRLPHQEVPSDPIQEDFPVCAVAHGEPPENEFPTALREVTSDPITEIPILHLENLFENKYLDQKTRRSGAARVHDPTWDYDQYGILARRTPSGEIEVCIPRTLRLTVRTPSSHPSPGMAQN